MVGRAFSAADRAVALDLSLTAREAAEQLGRSVDVVRQMRTKDRLRGQPVPEGKHGTHYAWRAYGCRCERCVLAAREHQRVWAAGRPLEARVRKAAQNAVIREARREHHNAIWQARAGKGR